MTKKKKSVLETLGITDERLDCISEKLIEFVTGIIASFLNQKHEKMIENRGDLINKIKSSCFNENELVISLAMMLEKVAENRADEIFKNSLADSLVKSIKEKEQCTDKDCTAHTMH
jgi:hypothetical protein